MGKAHSGKTSMRSIIFANYLARDTTRLSPTLDVEHHHVRFLGDLVLNLWDCGGQDAFYESYFERDRETIFRSVELLIYVFDIESDQPEKDFDHFCGVLEAIEENSPDARIFILIHKMDLVAVEDRAAILEDRKRLIEESCASCGVEHFQCFGTSIWDETLYKAWSEIVTNLIPNIRLLETHLNKFCTMCDADEVVLFERATFLVISHAQASSSSSSASSSKTRTPSAIAGGTGPLPANTTNMNTLTTLDDDDDDYLQQQQQQIQQQIQQQTTIIPSSFEEEGDHHLGGVPSSSSSQQVQQQIVSSSEDGGNDGFQTMTPPPPLGTSLASSPRTAPPPPPSEDASDTALAASLDTDGNYMAGANHMIVVGGAGASGSTATATAAASAAMGKDDMVPDDAVAATMMAGMDGTTAAASAAISIMNTNPSITTGGGTTTMTAATTATTTTLSLSGVLSQQTPYHISRTPHFDAHRFEKISNIVKQFKLSCGKAQAQFQGMQVRNSRFNAFIDAFTANTYIMVIVSNPHVHTAATLLNIQNARQHFERFIPRI